MLCSYRFPDQSHQQPSPTADSAGILPTTYLCYSTGHPNFNSYSATSRCSRPVFRTYPPEQQSKSVPVSFNTGKSESESLTMAATDNAGALNRSDSHDGCCPICQEHESIHAVAPCNHHICYKCSTRLRLLHEQFDCPICRSDCPKVLFVRQVKPYASFKTKDFLYDRKAKALFEDQSVRDEFINLTAHHCTVCSKDNMQQAFRTFKALQDHVRKTHQLYFCEVCIEHVKLFSAERKSYNRQDLATHKRKGDADDTSFKGHPLCQLCDNRFLDTDELWRHLRKDHYFCHFCDADGKHIYFGCYPDVKEHFREDHYMCEEDECANVEFTNAFRSEMDLKAHKAQFHLRGVKRSVQKQIRTLDIDINYGDERRSVRDRDRERGRGDIRRNNRPNYDDYVPPIEERTEFVPPSRSSEGGARHKPPQQRNVTPKPKPTPKPSPKPAQKSAQEDVDLARAMNASMKPSPATAPALVNVESTQDFPSLGGEAAKPVNPSPVPQNKSAARKLRSGIVMVDDNEEFPDLSGPPTTKPIAEPPGPSTASVATAKPEKVKKVKPHMAPAAVKTKSNPWSNTEDEFPTLEGASASSMAHGWHLPKPQPRPTARPTFNSNRPSINSSSDFPTLGGGQSSSLASIGTWINKNGVGGRSKQPAPAPEIVTSRRINESSQYVNSYSTENANKKASQHNGVESATTRVEKKTKKKDKKGEKSTRTDEKNNASNNVKHSADSKSKRNAESTDKTKDNVNSVDEKSTNVSTKEPAVYSNAENEKKEKNKKSKNEQSSPDMSSMLVSDSISTNASKLSADSPKASNKSKHTSKKLASLEASIAVTENDFPSLATHGKPMSAPTVSTSKPRDITKSEPKPYRPGKAPGLSHADYPSLSSADKAAPPGLSKAPPGLRKPPPGISAPPGLGGVKPATNGVSGKPPGFDNSAVSFSMSTLAAQLEKSSSINSTPQYIEPINMAQRNKKLSFKLKDLIYNSTEKFHKFRNLSCDFRSDLMSAQQFYDGCNSVLGEYIFLEILPELLVLLPDIQKQQDLYILSADPISQMQSLKSWSLSGDTTLSQCEICGQVLMKADASHHNSAHGGGVADYPTLSTSSNSKRMVKSAW